MFLVYINPLGKNHKGEFIYEFIFNDNIEIEFGEDWMVLPASSGSLTPPPMKYIKNVEILQTTELELELAIYSDSFQYSDAVENILAVGWEKESPDDQIRLVFQYGEKEESIIDKLYSRDIKLNKKK